MALRNSEYLAVAAIAAFGWVAAILWYRSSLRTKFQDEYQYGGLIIFASAALALAASFGCALLLRVGGVPDLLIAATQLAMSTLALGRAIWWQMRVHYTEDLESLSIDMVASSNAATAMTVAGTAFAPYGLIASLQLPASDEWLWGPIALFAAGVTVYSLVARSGGRRFSEALDRKYPPFRGL